MISFACCKRIRETTDWLPLAGRILFNFLLISHNFLVGICAFGYFLWIGLMANLCFMTKNMYNVDTLIVFRSSYFTFVLKGGFFISRTGVG